MSFLKIFKKLSSIFFSIFFFFAFIVFSDRKIAEYRANEFCTMAMKINDAYGIHDLLNKTKGAGHSVFTENGITVQFPLIFPERYVCLITLDQNGKPSRMEINYKD